MRHDSTATQLGSGREVKSCISSTRQGLSLGYFCYSFHGAICLWHRGKHSIHSVAIILVGIWGSQSSLQQTIHAQIRMLVTGRKQTQMIYWCSSEW